MSEFISISFELFTVKKKIPAKRNYFMDFWGQKILGRCSFYMNRQIAINADKKSCPCTLNVAFIVVVHFISALHIMSPGL